MIGQSISHYKILDKLGEGGMGVVYRAEDTRLKRTVALKFLPPLATADPEAKERFIQEAQAASSLDHTNICTIHEINETDDGRLYIVMPCYAGQTLKEKLTDGALSIESALDITEQIAKGLAKAHARGIVHRDIKPANIFITSDGVVKILDFGIAKLAGQTFHTKTGSTLGTVAYMSPEQAQGLAVDHRTDIWSLGVVLYEILAGRLPFIGEYDQAIMYRIIKEEPEPIAKHRPGLPSELLHVLNRSLEKDPNNRYQTLNDALIDVQRCKREKAQGIEPVMGATRKKRKLMWGIPALVMLAAMAYLIFFWPTPKPAPRLTLAVADVINETKEPELDGLSGLLITSLEQSQYLMVLPRYRLFDILKQIGKENISRIDEDLGRKICKQENLKILITTTIQKLGALYLIDIKALDIQKNEHLYTDREQAKGQENIPDMIDRLTYKLRKGLKEKEEQIQAKSVKVADITTSNLEANMCYFKAEELWNKYYYDAATHELNKAISLDSSYALAYLKLYLLLSEWGRYPAKQQLTILQKTIRMSARLPERDRYFLDALKEKEEKGWQVGIARLKQMEKEYPDEKEMLLRIGAWYHLASQFDSAEVYFAKVLKLDPTHGRAHKYLTWTYEERRLCDKELEAAKRFVAAVGSDQAYYELTKAAVLSGQFEIGLAKLRETQGLFPDKYRLSHFIAQICAHQGKYELAENELKRIEIKESTEELKRIKHAYLINIYPYTGQYRNVLLSIDECIRIHSQQKDTAAVAYWTLQKGLYFVWGWNNLDKAKVVINQVVPHLRKLSSNQDIGAKMGLLQAYLGDYVSAEHSAQDAWEGAKIVIQSLIQLKQDCSIVNLYSRNYYYNALFNKYQIIMQYYMAQSHFKLMQFDQAIYYLNLLHGMFELEGSRAIFYPKSFYLLGKIYEGKGDRQKAIANYQKLVNMWKNGDQDLPELIDAKARLASLQNIK